MRKSAFWAQRDTAARGVGDVRSGGRGDLEALALQILRGEDLELVLRSREDGRTAADQNRIAEFGGLQARDGRAGVGLARMLLPVGHAVRVDRDLLAADERRNHTDFAAIAHVHSPECAVVPTWGPLVFERFPSREKSTSPRPITSNPTKTKLCVKW